jgi:hypothetical protein
MGTEKDSPKERLLEACGPERPPSGPPGILGQQREKYFEAMLAKADLAAKLAQQAQGETEENYRRLNAYLLNDLPKYLKKTLTELAKEQLEIKVFPLENSVKNAVSTVDTFAKSVDEMTWEPRVLISSVLLGIVTVLFGGCMVRCTLLDDKMDEAKRYEVFGRKVAGMIEKCSPKDKEQIYKWIGGRP